MADVGGHMIHVAHYLFGKPVELSSVLTYYTETAKRSGIEENAVIVMKYPDDKIVTLECSWVSGAQTNTAELFGTKGRAQAVDNGPKRAEASVTYRIGTDPEVSVSSDDLPKNPTQHVLYWVEMMLKNLPNDIVGVDDLSNNGVSIDNAVEFVEIIDAVYRSAGHGSVTL